MAHSYTPGLTVTEQAVVRRRRMLSLPGSVLVTTGETVRANQAVARAELPGKVYPLNLANQLGVAPDEINEYLIKKAGDPVQKDEILAENKPLIKWLKTEILSPITGVVESVSAVTGQVLLREPPRVLELLGYVDGRIVEVLPQQGVVVETDCSLVQGIFGIGGETWGEIVIAVTSPDEALTPHHLTADMKGKVVVDPPPPVLQATGIAISRTIVQAGTSYTGEFSGSNLNAQTYFDVRFRAPGSTVDQEALNWQRGTSGSHTVPAGTAIGTWTFTGVRAHLDEADHSGGYTAVAVSLTIPAF